MFFKIVFRNLYSRKIKVIVIGLVITFGSFIAVLGGAFVESVSDSMRKSITNSISGDIQIYSSNAKEKLSIIGGPGGNFPDVGQVSNFSEVKDLLIENVPNIKAIVPQGVNFGMLNPGNILDIKLSELRNFSGSKKEEQALKDHIKQIIHNINSTYAKNVTEIGTISEQDLEKDLSNIKKALSPSFWMSFDSRRDDSLEFLENKIAPLIYDDNTFYFIYMGTVPDQYVKSFPLVEVVKGTAIPKGKRGFLFNEAVYEEQIKHRIAFRLDTIKEEIEENGKKIKDNKELQDKVKANVEQLSEIYNQMNPLQVNALLPSLKIFLGSNSNDINVLLANFFNMNDANFKSRYDFFYKEIAPKIILYKIKIGDVFPLKTFTKNGYANSVNLKVYGVFKYKNFENSPLAGHYNVMDLMSFRDLYGFLTEEKRAETEALSREMEKDIGALDISEDDVEKMFDDSRSIVTKVDNKSFSSVKISKNTRRNVFDLTYTEHEMENGPCLNAAILLKDTSKIEETVKQINRINDKYKLNIKALNWSEASGTLGQFAFIIKAILYTFIGIIFLVAMFIIMNSMLMATMERTREIGTMRAIGAQRSYVLKLILAETFMLSSIFGAIGVFLGVIVVEILHFVGIPAPSQVFLFLFSGPRLYLSIEFIYIVAVFILITVISLLSSYYPAYKATKIAPIRAMQRDQ